MLTSAFEVGVCGFDERVRCEPQHWWAQRSACGALLGCSALHPSSCSSLQPWLQAFQAFQAARSRPSGPALPSSLASFFFFSSALFVFWSFSQSRRLSQGSRLTFAVVAVGALFGAAAPAQNLLFFFFFWAAFPLALKGHLGSSL